MKKISIILALLGAASLNAMELSEADRDLDEAVSGCDPRKIEQALAGGAKVNDLLAIKSVRACLHKSADQAHESIKLLYDQGVNFTIEEEKEVLCGREKMKSATSPAMEAMSEALKSGQLGVLKGFKSCGISFSEKVDGMGLSPEELLYAHELNRNRYAFKVRQHIER